MKMLTYLHTEFITSNEFAETKQEAFRRGVIAGMSVLADWQNGERVVGVAGIPLKDVIRRINEELK